ncbi:MAG: diguanylate cyclase domain-containing protein, partial [Acidimicrobiales bacterium]
LLTEPERRAAVVCVELVAFHEISDRIGPAASDAVLVELARRLVSLLRADDSVARLGAGRFGVLIEDTTVATVAALADRILDGLASPYPINGQELHLAGRAGVAVSEPGQAADDVLRRAVAALSAAGAGKGGRRVIDQQTADDPVPVRPDALRPWADDGLAHSVLLQEAAWAANQADSLEDAAGVVLRQICAHLDCIIGHLWRAPGPLPGDRPVHLWQIADGRDYEDFRRTTEDLSVKMDAGLLANVVATARPAWIADVGADRGFPRREAVKGAGLESAFAFPVLVGRDVVAVLECFSRRPMQPTGALADVLSGIGVQLGRVVERERSAATVLRLEERLHESETQLRASKDLDADAPRRP